MGMIRPTGAPGEWSAEFENNGTAVAVGTLQNPSSTIVINPNGLIEMN
jgi:hypothetical protein